MIRLVALIALLSLAACRAPATDSPSSGDNSQEQEATTAAEPIEAAPIERASPTDPGAPFNHDEAAMALWNEPQIDWFTYEEGLATAAAAGVPAIVVVKTGWCPRCTQYADSFSNDDVVAATRDFVMILADQDAVPAVERDLNLDGAYVPRTIFLSPDGAPDRTLNSGRSDYQHFINPSQPEALLALMARAQDLY
ncbi:MAG: hypothetical protein ACJAYU_002953 [Bradymonadia bacterium]|jgi:hypothetical protein